MPSDTRPTVVLTGFEAFGDDPSGAGLNPSALAVRALHGRPIAGHRVVSAVLPCVYGASAEALQSLLKTYRPVIVLCVGQAGGRSALSLERIAVNLDDADMPDNAGVQRQDQRIAARGKTAYLGTLPVKKMQADVLRAGIACELSMSAGSFVCNHVFYSLMHLLATRASLRQTRGGFIHVPYLPEQAAAHAANHAAPDAARLATPAMDLDTIVRGLRIALKSALSA